MSTHKHIDKICCVVVVIALLLTILFMNGEALGIQSADKVLGYENRLFDTSKVHTIDIVMDDWDGFIETCENEEYALCSVVIDGEAYKNVGIRAKGNTSLSTVSSMNSDRYSFKIEFDQYDSTMSYHGLDKLSLNNIIQDTTYMKDYLTYRMMDEFGVDAPLCSYVYITVNGEDWGLYLAVEAIEDSFLQRNYGSDYGELYKPDSMSFGGGRGNGKDFNMEDFDFSDFDTGEERSGESMQGGFDRGDRGQQMPGNFDPSPMTGEVGGMELPEGFDPTTIFGQGGNMELPEGFDPSAMMGENGKMELPTGETAERPEDVDPSSMFGGGNRGGDNMGGGMGSSDVKLQYIDDNASSYSNIFNSAKTDVSEADQTRLIESLKALSSGEDIENVVDIDEVLRYFVVHNFVVNGDSYTGSMIHNYYLYEEDGQMSMIPWDYNLAYGTFQGSDASGSVNDPIDTPLSVTGSGDRPMADWIFSSEEYTELYHQYFAEFLNRVDFVSIIEEAQSLIAPYVEKDPTKFYSYEEFEVGVETLKEFCRLRAESVSGQLDGTIPSTDEGQAADSSNLVDATELNLSSMGSMGGTMGGGFEGNRGDMNFDRGSMQGGWSDRDTDQSADRAELPDNAGQSDNMTRPEETQQANGMEVPDGGQMPENVPQGMPNGMQQNGQQNMPGGFSGGNMPQMPSGGGA